MTAEIAIMNSEAVALAADSAVTQIVGTDRKIFTSANKLFALSKHYPVGIMIYGNASLMHAPWELVVKAYRSQLQNKSFAKLEHYARDFVRFIEREQVLFPNSVQEQFYEIEVTAYFEFMCNQVTKEIKSVIDRKKKISDNEVRRIVAKIVRQHLAAIQSSKSSPSTPANHAKTVMRQLKAVIDKTLAVFDKLPISQANMRSLKKIAAELSSKFPPMEFSGNSGVVIAGFGRDDYFPALTSLSIEMMVCNKLKYRVERQRRLSVPNDAVIMPFAQRELVHMFMEGIDPDLLNTEESYLAEVFKKCMERINKEVQGLNSAQQASLRDTLKEITDEEVKNHKKKLASYRRIKYVDPVMQVVSMLPKDELAAVAEALVNLTSFKRKVSTEPETVGGPIDVAVISRGDGFVWIKRKHYFQPELNPQFFVNYNR